MDSDDPGSWAPLVAQAISDPSPMLSGGLLWGLLIAAAVMLALSAAMSACGTALAALVGRLRPGDQGDVPKHRLLTGSMEHTLADVALCKLLANIGLIITLSLFMQGMTREWSPLLRLALTGGLAIGLIITIGETVPRFIAVRAPVAVVKYLIRPIGILLMVLSPLLFIIRSMGNGLFGMIGMKGAGTEAVACEAELKMLAAMGEAEGSLEDDERELVEGVLELSKLTADDIMVPRTEMLPVRLSDPRERVAEVLGQITHQRLLIMGETLDQVVGFLHRKDFLLNPDKPWRELLREPLRIPAVMDLGDLLELFRAKQVFIAVVVDEYGGTAGVISLKSVLEAIVGEIKDKGETEQTNGAPEEPIRREEDGTWTVWGRTELDDLNEVLPRAISDDRARTMSGYVINTLERIPEEGEELESEGYRFRVVKLAGPRIEEVSLVDTEGAGS